ncbi:hypothetical protein O3Q51_07390 [Cryomorphaceae bacterium 1068]|nr:hypothetical protein [Cryomorphaceae bacterium 1068]
MKRSILLTLFMATTVFAFSQKVKMSKDAKEKYVSQEVIAKERADENKMAVYAILRTESETGSNFVQIRLDESSKELPTKASTMSFPELEKLTRGKFSDKAEIDLLNYLAEEGWEVVAVENESEKKLVKRKYYLRKMVSL